MLRHILSTSVANLIGAVVGMGTGVVAARVLGVSGRGELAVVLNAVGLIYPLGSLGIKQVAALYCGKRLLCSEALTSFHLWFAPALSVATTFIAVALVFLSSDEYPGPLIVVALLAWTLLRLHFDYRVGLYLGLMDIYKVNLMTVARALMEFAAVAAFLVIRPAIESYLYGSSLSFAATLMAAYVVWGSPRYAGGPPVAMGNLVELRSMLTQFARRGALYALPMFVMSLNYGADVLMLKYYADSHAVGIYAVGVSLVNAIWFLPGIVNVVVFSHGVSVEKSRVDEYSRRIFRHAVRVMLLILPAIVLMGLLAGWGIRLVFGLEFSESATAFIWLLPGCYAMILFKLLNGDMAARGHPEVALKVFGIAFVVNVVLNMLLIPSYGYVGAAIASTLSYVAGSIHYAYNYIRITQVLRPGT